MKFDIEKTDINILLSIVNMKLRDDFSGLDDFSAYYGIKKEELEKRLKKHGYEYLVSNKQFMKKA
ncbi:MAG: DUF4250 domain-containing protein [Fusobacteriales bacterium]|jgi:hypothetical protein|nr:DUF4250 domain-containing protein [Fusobacteriales bacterium]